MPRKLQFIPETTPEVLPAVVILLDRLRGGGTEAQSLWLCEALREEGLSAGLCLLLPTAPNIGVDGFKDGYKLLASFRQFLKICQNSPPKALLCMGRSANCLGFIVKRRFPKVCLVATCRTNRSLPLFYRTTIRHADACWCNSQWAADQVSALGKGSVPVKVIPNALLRPELLSIDRSRPARQLARAELGIETDAAVLCMVASFVKGKNQAGLLRAVLKLPPSMQPYLLFAGEGPERSACEALAQELGLAKRTRFLGRVDDLGRILSAADLCVSTSLRDNLPNALIEAQAAGVPVVAYDVAGVREAFLPERSGYAIPADSEPALGAVIEELLYDRAKANTFGQAGRSWAAERFAPKTIAKAYREHLEAIYPRLSPDGEALLTEP